MALVDLGARGHTTPNGPARLSARRARPRASTRAMRVCMSGCVSEAGCEPAPPRRLIGRDGRASAQHVPREMRSRARSGCRTARGGWFPLSCPDVALSYGARHGNGAVCAVHVRARYRSVRCQRYTGPGSPSIEHTVFSIPNVSTRGRSAGPRAAPGSRAARSASARDGSSSPTWMSS